MAQQNDPRRNGNRPMAKLPEKSAKQASSQGRKDGGKAPVKREEAAAQAEERRIRKEEKLHWKRIRRGRRRHFHWFQQRNGY